ncbi:MAG: M23 family metallopeptidase [Clostridia bacterium]|nr:M23 family metallopeptidase [Clostridia bacterium]
MIKTSKENNKKDWFTNIMIAQSVVCLILVVWLFVSASNEGSFASLMRSEYARLMTDDITADDIEQAFKTVKNQASVFSSADSADDIDVFEFEPESVKIGGGEDLQFSSLDALEGICFEKYTVNFDIAVPLKNYEITSGFGYRISPITGKAGLHTGIDLATDYGEKIYAAADGVVLDSAYDNSYGYYIKLQHPDNVVTIYAHCSSLCVDEGDEVRQGDVIAKVGSTGASTGNHLHFEMRKDNIRINPEYALTDL